jgi:hypothetical protein
MTGSTPIQGSKQEDEGPSSYTALLQSQIFGFDLTNLGGATLRYSGTQETGIENKENE